MSKHISAHFLYEAHTPVIIFSVVSLCRVWTQTADQRGARFEHYAARLLIRSAHQCYYTCSYHFCTCTQEQRREVKKKVSRLGESLIKRHRAHSWERACVSRCKCSRALCLLVPSEDVTTLQSHWEEQTHANTHSVTVCVCMCAITLLSLWGSFQ